MTEAPPAGRSITRAYPSPDGKSLVEIRLVGEPLNSSAAADDVDCDKGPCVEVKSFGPIGSVESSRYPFVDAELLWSEDSEAFAVTSRGHGDLGTHWLEISKRTAVRTYGLDVTMTFRRALGETLKDCRNPNLFSVGAVAWLDSDRLLVAAEPAKYSGCGPGPEFRLYEYEVESGTILKSYDASEARKAFPHLLGSHLLSDGAPSP